METKKYLSPITELILINVSTHLMDWSAPKADRDTPGIADAKQVVIGFDNADDREDENTIIEYKYSVWDD